MFVRERAQAYAHEISVGKFQVGKGTLSPLFHDGERFSLRSQSYRRTTISAFCPRIANFHVGKFQVGKGTLSPLFMVQTLFFKQPKLSRTSIEMRCGRRKGNSQITLAVTFLFVHSVVPLKQWPRKSDQSRRSKSSLSKYHKSR